MCTNPIHKVKKAFTNQWGMIFYKGRDDVVIGLYYQKWGNNEYFYHYYKMWV
jgi:hypothetical protein